MTKIRAVRGMADILPDRTPTWRHLESRVRDLLASYGYAEIRLPVVEATELFARSIGGETDIVGKEMYSFTDKGGGSITLRPEGTAGCVRACEEQGLLFNQVQRLWYMGPMFRYERPQRGRYRQFHQLGVEAFGMAGPDIDAEIILMSGRLFDVLDIEPKLQLGCLGSLATRAAYCDLLVTYLERHRDSLDEDSRRRLAANPLRILDTKDVGTLEVLEGAPLVTDHLDDRSRADFEGLQEILSAAGLAFEVNPRLVRGLDYYTGTLFEWVTDELGAQGTLCGGGRYDGLVEQLGGRPTPAVGWALGLERLILLLEARGTTAMTAPDAYLIGLGEGTEARLLTLAEELRDHRPGLAVQTDCAPATFKAGLKRADRSGATVAVILGVEGLAADQVLLKPLRGGEQVQLECSALAAALDAELGV